MQRLKSWYLRKRAKYSLIHRYEYLIEVEKILEGFITTRILRDKNNDKALAQGRKELADKQQEIKNLAFLIDYLKKIR